MVMAGNRVLPDGPVNEAPRERKRVYHSAGPLPDVIEFRYCPTDPMHWRSEGEKCPVCHAKIQVALYVPDTAHDLCTP